MRAENVDVLILRLQEVISKSAESIVFMRSYQKAESVVTLTAEQKTEAMGVLNGMASGISTAYDDAVEAFTATDVIEIPQPPDPIPDD